MDIDPGLIVDARGVKLLRAGGYRGISRNQLRHRAAVGLDAKRKGRYVQKQHVLHAAIEDIRLHCGA